MIGQNGIGAEEALLLNEAAAHFDLGEVNEINPAQHGNANRNYFLETTTGQYVVKHILEHPEEDVVSEAKYLQRLVEQRFPVVPYLETDDGSVIHTAANGELVVAMPRVTGQHPVSTAETAREIGRSFGLLHTLSYDGLTPRPTWLDKTYMPQSVGLIQEHLGPQEAKDYQVALTSLPADELHALPKAIIHADMDPSNCLFKNGKAIAFFDWEESSVGAAVLDLATCVQNFCYNGDSLDQDTMSAMLQAYESVRPLSSAERLLLPAALGYVGLTLSVWSELQYKLYHPGPDNGSLRLYWDRQLNTEAPSSEPAQ